MSYCLQLNIINKCQIETSLLPWNHVFKFHSVLNNDTSLGKFEGKSRASASEDDLAKPELLQQLPTKHNTLHNIQENCFH